MLPLLPLPLAILEPENRLRRIAFRLKDIEETKKGKSYQFYILHVSEDKRMLTPRIDPDSTSVRSWNGKLRAWRLRLHAYREYWESEFD